MSIGTIGISINWLFDGRGNEKYIRLKNLKWGPVILSFTFILYVIWLIQSTNYNNALNVLLIKLPLLSLPIVVGTSSSFNKKELKILLITFFSGLVLSSLISLMIYLEILPPKESTGDFRELSRTMHHIRYSLLIAISIVIALHLILYSNVKEKKCWPKPLKISTIFGQKNSYFIAGYKFSFYRWVQYLKNRKSQIMFCIKTK